MPELPEIELIKLQLERFIVGHKIERVVVKNNKVFKGNLVEIEGAKFECVRRFAKVLSLDLSNGKSLLIHVKLTGQIIYRGPNLKSSPTLSKKVSGGVPGPHTHVIFELDQGGKLYYNDIRRFGWIKVLDTKDVEKEGFISKLGPEPFKNLNFKYFSKTLSKTKRNIKTLLMDQSKIGGIGNIYANDALFDAGISPQKPANTLTQIEQKKLYNSIEKVLKIGIKTGGASELSFVTPDGFEGKYQDHALVYGREGKLCRRSACRQAGEKIKKITLSGRGTYFCPRCQKR